MGWENASSLWDLISTISPTGELHKQRMAQTQAMQAGAQTAQLNAQTAQQQQNALGDAMNNLSEDRLNEGFSTNDAQQISSNNPRFWNNLNPSEQAHVQSFFPHVNANYNHLIPKAYDNWVTQQYRVLPNIQMPLGMDKMFGGGVSGGTAGGAAKGTAGGASASNPFGVVEQYIPEIDKDGNVRYVAHDRVLGLDDNSINDIAQQPETAWAKLPGEQATRGKQLGDSIIASRDRFAKMAQENQGMKQYLGSGERMGAFQAWNDVQHMLQQAKGDVNNLSSADQKLLVMRYGQLTNPGMGVRDWEFKQLSEVAGLPAQVQNWWTSLSQGKKLAPEAVTQLVNSVKGMHDVAQQQFDQGLMGVEKLLPPVVKLEHMVQNPALLQDYYKRNGPYIATQAQYDNLPPGQRYHAADGSVHDKGGAQSAPAQTPAWTPSNHTLPDLDATLNLRMPGQGLLEGAATTSASATLPSHRPSIATAPKESDYKLSDKARYAEDMAKYRQTAEAANKNAYTQFMKFAPQDVWLRAYMKAPGAPPKPQTSAFLGLGNPDNMDADALKTWITTQLQAAGDKAPPWLVQLGNALQVQLPQVQPPRVMPIAAH